MKADDIQIKILLNLLEYEELGYNQLYNRIAPEAKGPTDRPVARGTFRKRLYALSKDWDPPLVTYETQEKQGKRSRFYLTKAGKRKAVAEKMLVGIQDEVDNFFKKFFDETIEHGERKPLVGVCGILSSKGLPIFGIIHLSSTKQYRTLVKKLAREEPRKEVCRLVGRVIDLYAEDEENSYLYCSDYLPYRESCSLISFLGRKESIIVRDLISMGYFDRANQLLDLPLMKLASELLFLINKKFALEPDFKKGKDAILTLNALMYDPKTKTLKPSRQNPMFHESLIKRIEEMSAVDVKDRFLTMLKSSLTPESYV